MNQTIIGHSRQLNYFKELIENDRLSHSYCFAGNAGIGKRLVAYAVARDIMCQNESDIQKFNNGNHPDFYAIVKDKKILTADTQNISEFLYKRPLLSKTKVLIIDDAGQMEEQAQNKLLKILEEPPRNTLIILITENSAKLLDTINSRTIRVGFNPLSQRDIEELCALHQVDYDRSLVSLAAGSFGDYKAWQADSSQLEKIESLITILIQLILNQPENWLPKLALLDAYKEDSATMFNIMRLVISDAIMILGKMDERLLYIPTYTKKLTDNNFSLEISPLYGMIEEINSAQRALDRGQNYSLITEGLLFKIQEALHG